MLHLNLSGLVNIMAINKKNYALVVVDNYTKFPWFYFLSKKNKTPQLILELINIIEKNLKFIVNALRSEKWIEFKNLSMEEFYRGKGITHQFLN